MDTKGTAGNGWQWVLIPRMHTLLDTAQPSARASPLIMKWRWRRIIRKAGGDPRGFAGSGCAIRPR